MHEIEEKVNKLVRYRNLKKMGIWKPLA